MLVTIDLEMLYYCQILNEWGEIDCKLVFVHIDCLGKVVTTTTACGEIPLESLSLVGLVSLSLREFDKKTGERKRIMTPVLRGIRSP